MANATIVSLTGLVLPDASPLRRDLTWPDAPEDFRRKYDNRTVFYDSVWRADLQRHVLNAPSFLNLWAPFSAGLHAEGGRVRIARRITWKRSEQIHIEGSRDGIGVSLGGRTWPLRSRDSETDRFAGLRCAVTLNRNNDLRWVHDWAHYHVRRHGLEGVALVDNGSDAYMLEDLRRTLAAVAGLKQAVVYSAPYPYGPPGRGGKRFPLPKFFQSGMLNTARDDALARARSVLNCDIDELVLGPEGETIFESAERSALGMTTFLGYWAYPADMAAGAQPQAAHVYRDGEMRKVNRKWCLVPDKFIGRNWLWDVHQTGGILQNLFTTSHRFSHAHCRACTTGWRPWRFEADTSAVHDPALERTLRAYLPAESFAGSETTR